NFSTYSVTGSTSLCCDNGGFSIKTSGGIRSRGVRLLSRGAININNSIYTSSPTSGGKRTFWVAPGDSRLRPSDPTNSVRYIDTSAKLGNAGNISIFIGQAAPDVDGINGNSGLIAYNDRLSGQNSINLGSEQGNAGNFSLTIVEGSMGTFGAGTVSPGSIS